MKTHAIIPIFVPHEGCRNSCVFCNQQAITAREKAPDIAETESIIESHLEQIGKNPNISRVDVAFYGGSFTGIPGEHQEEYLKTAKRYKEEGRIQEIHLSTRPDYIDETILRRLDAFGVDMVELGVQSFDDEVLRLSRRGHDAETVCRSAAMIKEHGISLGIQLMTGLPGDSYEKSVESARQAVRLGPDTARIYPVVILQDTELCRMYQRGEYSPLPEKEAVRIVRDMLRIFYDAGVYVLRVGLKSTGNITSGGGAVAGGEYHPAFRQMAEAALAREDLENMLEEQLKGVSPERRKGLKTTFYAAPGSFSVMAGPGKSNKLYFSGKYPELNLKFAADPEMPRNKYRVRIEFADKL